MKCIEKKKQNEPDSLREYRETTPNASYIGFTDSDKSLKIALLEEQGHICAYCNRRISLSLNADFKPKIEVEHYLSQDTHPELSLDYKNMLGVCNGITTGKNEHCDKSKKEHLLKKLDPRKQAVEKFITYSLKGKVTSIGRNNDVEDDISLLNLNDSFLEDARKQIMDEALKQMKQQYPKRQWTKYLFDKEIDKWKSRHKGKFRSYCQAAIWFLELLKKSKRYPVK